MTTSSTAITSNVNATLASEGWAEVRPPQVGAPAIAFTGPELIIRLAPGGHPAAELTGHPIGCPSSAIWSLSVAGTTEAHLLDIARVAADSRPLSVFDLAGHLAGAGWTVDASGPSSPFACPMMASADGRALIRLRSAEDLLGGWAIDGDGFHADATDNVPAAAPAVPTTAPQRESVEASDPRLALEAGRPEPPEPDEA